MKEENRSARTATQAGSFYCARCLAAAAPGLAECPGCASPFTGAGRFDLVHGPAPSSDFAFLFPSRDASHHRAASGLRSRHALR